MKSHKIVQRIFLLIAAILIAFVIAELALRMMNYHPRFMEMDMFVEQDNELLPYTLKPKYSGKQIGKNVTIDSQGYRVIKTNSGDANNQFVNADSKTILILGDSVVFGFGLEDDETIASQLQALINEKGANYFVQNIGAPGYTSWNEYEALNQYLSHNLADIVVLFYVFNDITLDNNELVNMKRDQQNKYSPIKRTLYENIYFLSFMREWVVGLYNNTGPQSDSPGAVVEQLNNTYLNQKALDYSMEAIAKIKSVCDQNNIELLVAIPRFHMWYYSYPEFSKNFEYELLTRFNNLGVNAFIAKSHVDSLSVEGINVFRNDSHPSPQAVRYMVNDVYEQIENER